MRILAGLFLVALSGAASAPPLILFDDLVDVPPGQARTLAVPAQRGPARIACQFRVLRGGNVRLLLLPAGAVEDWIAGRPSEELGSAGFGQAGTLAHLAAAPRELVLVAQARNGSRGIVRIRLLVRILDPDAPFPPPPQPADPRRGEILVWTSLGLFALSAAAGGSWLARLFAERR